MALLFHFLFSTGEFKFKNETENETETGDIISNALL